MGRLIAARPRRPDALDHPADMTVGLDQLGHELGRQVETCLSGEPRDFVVGGRIGHVLSGAQDPEIGARQVDHLGRRGRPSPP